MAVELEKIPLLSSRTRGGKCVLVIHGGAGTITRQGSTLEQQAHYKASLRTALLAGFDVLQVGGEAMDAAVAAVAVMEGLAAPVPSRRT
jgi:beta-aspartyl-peptidase (threonine type)